MSDPKPSAPVSLLERLTGIVLILVLIAVGWMVLVTLMPALPRLMSVEAEVLGMVGLLTASLVLVSVVALAHTRR
jgi:hypothetical protein